MTASPDQVWWTATEIAEAALAGLPTTTQKVTATAIRLQWRGSKAHARRRAGRGGGWEYHWTLFPARAQDQLLAHAKVRRAAPPPPARADRDVAWDWFEGMPDTVKAGAQSRLATIQYAEALRDGGR